jgi:hypothetical protein
MIEYIRSGGEDLMDEEEVLRKLNNAHYWLKFFDDKHLRPWGSISYAQ